MKITEGQLRRIIRQEVRALRENMGMSMGSSAPWAMTLKDMLNPRVPYGNPARGEMDPVGKISKAVNTVHSSFPELDSADIWDDLLAHAAAYGVDPRDVQDAWNAENF